jgi:hypothetical protein
VLLSESILLLAALAAIPALQGPMLRVDTTKPLSAFGSCFVATQEQTSRPWSFVPNGRGGVFSDAGADGITAPYRLQVREDGQSNRLLLFAAAGADQFVRDVERCR